MKIFKISKLFFVRLFVYAGLLFYCQAQALAQTTDLTKHIASTAPAGYTLTWHTGTPATSQNQYSTPTAAPPGLYYAAYLNTASSCYSQAVPVRYAAFQCGTETADLRNYTGGLVPAGYQVTYHSGYPATSSNELTPAQVAAAPVGSTYQIALKETTSGCYSPSRPIIVDGMPIPDYGNLPVDNSEVVWPAAYATIAPTGARTWLGINNDEPTTECATNIFDQHTNGFEMPASLGAPGTSAIFKATLNSDVPGTTVYYGIWVDWNNDGVFNDLDGNGNPSFYTGNAIVGATAENVNVSISIPNNFSPLYKVRVISSISPITASQSSGATLNGEVEDYAGNLIILPITFGAISATANKCAVTVDFEYLSADRTGAFTIEYFDAQNETWQALYSINASIINGNKIKYIHAGPNGGVNLYRVKYVGKGGEIVYSKTVSAVVKCDVVEKITLYPNPFKNQFTVALPATFNSGTIRISDAVGRTQLLQTATAANNVINTQLLAPGMYIVEVMQHNKVVFTGKVFKR